MAGTGRLTTAGRFYLATVIAIGTAIVAHSLYAMSTNHVPLQWFVLAGLTLLSGSFTVRVPTISARLSVSETFVFAAALLYGPPAATVIVLLDTLVISLWQGQRSTTQRVLFNAAAPSVAIWTASRVFYWLSSVRPLSIAPQPILSLVPELLALAVVYFLLNTWLIAFAVAFQKQVSAFRVWRQNFSWLSLNYFSGASVAALLLPLLNTSNQSEFARIIGILLPLLWVSYLTLRTALGRVDDANRHLTELNKLYLSTIETLAMAIDAKDQITHGHIRRVQSYAVGLAKDMGVSDEPLIRAIEAAALLHDMGKLAVPEYILNKPGALTPAEFEKMKLHASVGADILSAIDFPYPVVPIVRHHHECWDGSGYPDGLKGSDIPMGARILSVVDCFDALTSDRPYRPRLNDKEAIRILMERRGTMYDPLVVDTFVRIHSSLTPEIGAKPSKTFTAITDAAVPRLAARSQPLEDITSSSEEMLALFTLARELTGRMTVADVGGVLLKHLRRMVPSSLTVFYIYDQHAGDLVATHVSGEHAETILGLRIPLGERLSGWVGANRQSIRNSDPILDFGDSARTMAPRLRSCLSSPLLTGDDLVGVLSLYARGADAFTEDHQHLVEIVARQVSPALQRSVDYAEPGLAFLDPATGLPNFGRVKELTNEQSDISGVSSPTSLIYVNVSQVRAVGLVNGRSAADQTLHEVLRHLQGNLRAADVLFRLDNDEFAVLLLQTDRETATAIAARMRTSASPSSGTSVSKFGPKLVLSVVSTPEDGTRLESLVDSARRKVMGWQKGTSSSPASESIH